MTIPVAVAWVGSGAKAIAAVSASPIRVTLTAEDHHPHASTSPSRHWWYCVKITTTNGGSVASMIRVQILSGRTVAKAVAQVWLRKGYNHWCQAIGGESNVLNVVPRGKSLIFQAVVKADGVTVKRNWPIVVS